MRQQAVVIAIALFLAMCIAQGPALTARSLGNLGMLALLRTLAQETAHSVADEAASMPAPVAASTVAGALAMRWFQQAAALHPDSLTIRWGWARSALGMDDAAVAVEAVGPLVDQVATNPLLYQDVLLAFGRAGMFQKVVDLYETRPLLYGTTAVSDTVAIAYLESGRPDALILAWQLRPADLYINYQLWQERQRAGDQAGMVTYHEALAHFSPQALTLTDERVLSYLAEVMPALLEEGIWQRDVTLYAVSYLVWRYYEIPATERLLEQFVEAYPAEPEWLFYLAELYQRQGQWSRAEAVYHRVLELDPSWFEVFFRLGAIAEAQHHWQQAALWYSEYHEARPEDVAGLASVEAEELGQALRKGVDVQDAVAKLLKLAPEQIEFGPDLLPEGEFNKVSKGLPEGWIIADYATGTENPKAAFFTGVDLVAVGSDSFAARIDGLWMQEGATGFYGLVSRRDAIQGTYAVEVQPRQFYVITGLYKTNGPDEQAAVYLGNPEITILDAGLPATEASWNRFIYLACSSGRTAQNMQFIIRLWNPGRVWFANISVRAVGVPVVPSDCAG